MKKLTMHSRTLIGFNSLFITALVLFLAASSITVAVAPSQALAQGSETTVEDDFKGPDPLEKFNRSIYRFNDRVDRAVLRPLAVRYVKYVPPKVRRGVKNFFSNLREPTTIINDLLQGKVTQAAQDTMRFALNTTAGLLGIFDVATHLGLERNREDFGQTLGKWGVPSGPYLVLPFLGPSNIRDTAGLIPQYMYTDLTAGIEDDGLMWTIFAARAVDVRSDLLKADRVLAEQLDPYVFIRESYSQRRISEIHDGNPPEQEDEFLEELLREQN